jgi:hypothetical protein
MKKYNIEPARLKGLLKSAEQDLGLSSEEAAKHVAKTISQETVNTKFKAYGYKKDPVSKLHHQEQAFITENRIRADLGYWAKYPSWTQIEAVYLMRGLDLNKILMDKNILTTASRYNYPTFNEIQQTNELAQRFILEGKMNVREHPIVWIHWAGENDLPVATSLEDLVLEYHKGQMTPETRQKYDTQLESVLFKAPLTEVKPNQAEAVPRQVEENSLSVNTETKSLFEINTEMRLRQLFFEEIREILIEKRKGAQKKPTSSELIAYLKNNPDTASHFIGLTHHNEIEYAVSEDRKETKKTNRNSLQSLINRLTKEK